jgi:hypothetical protein
MLHVFCQRLALVACTAAALILFDRNAAWAEVDVNCATQPGQASSSGRWHYKLDRSTRQKCWFFRSAKPATGFFWNPFSAKEDPRLAAVARCASKPNAPARGWYRTTDRVTGQECWHFSRRLGAARAQLLRSKSLSRPSRTKGEDEGPQLDNPATTDTSTEKPSGSGEITGRESQEPAVEEVDSVFKLRWVDLPQMEMSLASELRPAALRRFAIVGHAPMLSKDDRSSRPFLVSWMLGVSSTLMALFATIALGLYGWIGLSFWARRPSGSAPYLPPFRVSEIVSWTFPGESFVPKAWRNRELLGNGSQQTSDELKQASLLRPSDATDIEGPDA